MDNPNTTLTLMRLGVSLYLLVCRRVPTGNVGAERRPCVPSWAGSPFKSQVPPRSASENPNGRQGFEPVLQGRVMMEHRSSPAPAFVGIDVSKYRLDVYVRPANSALSFARDAAGIPALAAHLIPTALTVDSSVTWSDAADCDSCCSPSTPAWPLPKGHDPPDLWTVPLSTAQSSDYLKFIT
jgi:hypothetical protein